MKRFTTIAFILLVSFTCTAQDAYQVITQTIKKIQHCKTISHFSQQKWGDLADVPNFTTNEGTCIFKIVPADTVIGGYYTFKPTDHSQIYAGQYLYGIDWKDHTMTVTDLKQYPDQAKYITSPMLYTQSALELYNLMKQRLKAAPGKIRLLNDTIISGMNCKQVLLVLADTIVNNERHYYHKTIAIDTKTSLPVHCISVAQSEYGKQIIECSLSGYKINDPSLDQYTFTGDHAPGNIKRVQYTPPGRKSRF